MANVNHSALSDPYLHEPKGVSTATQGSIYVADGAGSGSWSHAHHYVGGYVDFDSVSPESQAITTVFSALNPTFSLAENSGFTALSTPNARLRYDEPEAMIATINFSTSIRHAAGGSRDVELALYLNGSPISGAHVIQSTDNSEWHNLTLVGQVEIAQNDYIEVWAKSSQNLTLETASAFLTVKGVFKP
jgi:hypothetical protein